MRICTIFATISVLAAPGAAQESFELVSATPSGAPSIGTSSYAQVTPDGRYVVFWSTAPDLVPGDTNDTVDIFVRDLETRTTERVSLTDSGAQIDGPSTNGSPAAYWAVTPQISDDGALIAFSSPAAGIVPGDTNGSFDVFVRDRIAGTTTRISVSSDGSQMTGASCAALMSANGRRIVFAHRPIGAPYEGTEWFVHDRATGVTSLASVGPNGQPVQIDQPLLARDGRHFAFAAYDGALPQTSGTFVRDLDASITLPAVPGSGWQHQSIDITPIAISETGRYLLCYSFQDLDPTDSVETSNQCNAWALDRQTSEARRLTRIVSHPQSPWQPSSPFLTGLSWISRDGRTSRFSGNAALLSTQYEGDTTYYECDAVTAHIRVLSLDRSMRPLQAWTAYDFRFAASEDGRTVVMQSNAGLAEGLPHYIDDFGEQLFARRIRAPADMTVCAGDGSGAACPCGTLGIAGRGCANAFTDRGALLETRGNASLADDTLTMIAYETTPGLSLLLQSSSASPAGGVPFEGGVLCVGSPARRIALDSPYWDDLWAVKIFGRGAFNGPRLHEVGGITAPGTRYYQVWTRAVGGPSCVESRSSLTNGVRVEWRL